jgi:acetyltransferase-like isoleucine patch superfamily enzyme
MNRLHRIRQRYGSRWLIVVCVRTFQQICQIRDKLVISWLRLITKGTKGKGIVIGRHVSVTAGCWLEFGDNLRIGARSILEISVNPAAFVTIGTNTWISHDCHICSYNRIDIGSDVLIGEFVSLRDSSHAHSDIALPMKNQKDILGRIVIEDDVWIGRGCLVQGKPEGVVIGRGAIVAANSVVSRSIPTMEIWGGVPARFIKRRFENMSATKDLVGKRLPQESTLSNPKV